MAYGVNAPFGLRPLSSILGGSWTEKTNEYLIYTNAGGTTTYATSIFTGDPVVWNPTYANAGTISVYLPAFTDNAPSTFSALPILGVFQGCEYTDTTARLVKSPFWPAGTLVYPGSIIKAWVIDDPDVVYDVQVSTNINAAASAFVAAPYFPSTTTTPALAGQFGRNFALNIAGGSNFTTVLDPNGNPYTNNPTAGSIVTGQSAFYLDVSTQAAANDYTHDYNKTTVTLPLKAIGYTQNPNNTAPPTLTMATTPFLNVRVMINNSVYGHNTPGTTLA